MSDPLNPGLYRQVPAAGPSAGHRHWLHGMALMKRARWHQASAAFLRATREAPGDVLFWVNLAQAERRSGDLARAEVSARRALVLGPADGLARRLLGEILAEQHRHAEAAEILAPLAADDAADPDALVLYGATLMSLLRQADAMRILLLALQRRPAHALTHALLADALRDQGRKIEAVECLKTALALDPDYLEARVQLSFEKRHVCDWADLETDVSYIRRQLDSMGDGAARLVAPFGLLSLPLEPERLLRASRAESRSRSAAIRPMAPVVAHPCEARIKIGWLSYDFREHPVSQLLVEVLEAFDRSRFELRLYSAGPEDGSALRQRMRLAADAFIDVGGLSDAAAAARIRDDGVHLLVDLMGYTRGNRLPILAHRPAPVQVAYLGYPGTTGTDFIDYIVGDPLVTPPELAGNYSEKLAQLPLTMQPNGRSRPLPQPMPRAQAGLPEDAFVMCAFNHTYKILPEAFDTWCRVMQQVPNAVLWLKETNAQLHDNVRGAARARGIDPARLIFAPSLSYVDHFSRLALADVFVDTWPYNAHTTASDALWAGVPVVTLYGNSYASRVAASVLNAAGLAELAFATVEEYRCAITALGTDAELRAGYKRHLNERRFLLPLYDTPRYARELQALFERMVGRWGQGLAPDHLLADHSLAS